MTNPSPDAPEPPALDILNRLFELGRKISWGVFPTGWEGPAHDTLLDAKAEIERWQAASAAQAKRIAELERDYAQLLDRAVTANKAHSATLTRAEAAEKDRGALMAQIEVDARRIADTQRRNEQHVLAYDELAKDRADTQARLEEADAAFHKMNCDVFVEWEIVERIEARHAALAKAKEPTDD